LPTASRNSATRARRTRRVLVPARLGAGNQRIGRNRAALIGPQRLAPSSGILKANAVRTSPTVLKSLSCPDAGSTAVTAVTTQAIAAKHRV